MHKRLKSLQVLALDCQATSASPEKGRLIEIGWAVTTAGAADNGARTQVDSHLLRLPDDTALPSAVKRVTGISTESLADATAPIHVWRELDRRVRETADAAGLELCPAVIHFARYETPFLKDLYSRYASDRQFPFQVICTHEIARRLLPGLPRKGLRAVAGYFGHGVGPLRRCATHVQATALIWRHLVRKLGHKHAINSWEALQDWLHRTKPRLRPGRNYPLRPDIRKEAPDRPGIYRMLRSNGDLLYVGKAKSLKKRVNSYFRPGARHAEHTLEMLSQARRLDFTTTATALEAAVLECDQIKKMEPPYNVALKNAERELVFCRHDLSASAADCAGGRWVGPFPSPRVAASLLAFAGWWSAPGRVSAEAGLAILNMPTAYQPPPDCARAGLELFCRSHAGSLGVRPALRAVTALGARFWKDKLVHADPEDDLAPPGDDEENAADAETGEREWTPEAVHRSIEQVISHAAHMLRRARWFCLLSESSLAWKTLDDGAAHRLITVRKGHLARSRFHQIGVDLPVPAGHSISRKQRSQNLDLPTYDRLRVLTTEIRRLAAENRYLALCLGPGRNLGGTQLRQLLKWV